MIHQSFNSCIAACSECIVESNNCANSDLNEQDIKILVRCIKLNRDCAAICALAMEAMAADSEFVKQICKLCAEICDACEDECKKHSHMEHCSKCAEACGKCAVECMIISKMA